MPWLQAHLTVDKTRAPLIELLFENLGAAAVSIDDAADEPMLEPAPGEMPLWQANRVTGLFDGGTDADALRAAINRTLSDDVGRHLILERLDDRDWERAWMDLFKPMRFGERLWIRPSGSEIAQTDAVIVDLDPGLAFGTGTHPTTAMCLQWLDGHTPVGGEVVDFGCGSGVLAIAALKLGARHVTAIDHDPQALTATLDNARRNRVDDRITVVHSDDPGGAQADLVVANILANVLVALAPRIVALLRPGARLVLSGILDTQAEEVRRAYAGWVRFDALERRDEWTLLAGVRHA